MARKAGEDNKPDKCLLDGCDDWGVSADLPECSYGAVTPA